MDLHISNSICGKVNATNSTGIQTRLTDFSFWVANLYIYATPTLCFLLKHIFSFPNFTEHRKLTKNDFKLSIKDREKKTERENIYAKANIRILIWRNEAVPENIQRCEIKQRNMKIIFMKHIFYLSFTYRGDKFKFNSRISFCNKNDKQKTNSYNEHKSKYR